MTRGGGSRRDGRASLYRIGGGVRFCGAVSSLRSIENSYPHFLLRLDYFNALRLSVEWVSDT